MGKKYLKEPREEGKNVTKCAICYEKQARAGIACQHKFCMSCISRWAKVLLNVCVEKTELPALPSLIPRRQLRQEGNCLLAAQAPRRVGQPRGHPADGLAMELFVLLETVFLSPTPLSVYSPHSCHGLPVRIRIFRAGLI